MNGKRSQLSVVNDIMNDKKGHNIVNDSLPHKPDGLLSKYSRNVNRGNTGIKLQYNKTFMFMFFAFSLKVNTSLTLVHNSYLYIECWMYLSEARQYEREH